MYHLMVAKSQKCTAWPLLVGNKAFIMEAVSWRVQRESDVKAIPHVESQGCGQVLSLWDFIDTASSRKSQGPLLGHDPGKL